MLCWFQGSFLFYSSNLKNLIKRFYHKLFIFTATTAKFDVKELGLFLPKKLGKLASFLSIGKCERIGIVLATSCEKIRISFEIDNESLSFFFQIGYGIPSLSLKAKRKKALCTTMCH